MHCASSSAPSSAAHAPWPSEGTIACSASPSSVAPPACASASGASGGRSARRCVSTALSGVAARHACAGGHEAKVAPAAAAAASTGPLSGVSGGAGTTPASRQPSAQ